MKTLYIITLSLLMLLYTSASYASNTTPVTSDTVEVCGPGPIGKALAKFLKPYIKKSVNELVKRNIVSKAAGKKISRTIIGCTTVSGICKLAQSNLDAENLFSMGKSSIQYGYETFIQPHEISTQVKSNMREYLQRYKEEHQIE